jgi:hypothetical protein
VLAGAIVVAAGLVVAVRAFRPARVTVPAEAAPEAAGGAPAEVPAGAPARALEATGA